MTFRRLQSGLSAGDFRPTIKIQDFSDRAYKRQQLMQESNRNVRQAMQQAGQNIGRGIASMKQHNAEREKMKNNQIQMSKAYWQQLTPEEQEQLVNDKSFQYKKKKLNIFQRAFMGKDKEDSFAKGELDKEKKYKKELSAQEKFENGIAKMSAQDRQSFMGGAQGILTKRKTDLKNRLTESQISKNEMTALAKRGAGVKAFSKASTNFRKSKKNMLSFMGENIGDETTKQNFALVSEALGSSTSMAELKSKLKEIPSGSDYLIFDSDVWSNIRESVAGDKTKTKVLDEYIKELREAYSEFQAYDQIHNVQNLTKSFNNMNPEQQKTYMNFMKKKYVQQGGFKRKDLETKTTDGIPTEDNKNKTLSIEKDIEQLKSIGNLTKSYDFIEAKLGEKRAQKLWNEAAQIDQGDIQSETLIQLYKDEFLKPGALTTDQQEEQDRQKFMKELDSGIGGNVGQEEPTKKPGSFFRKRSKEEEQIRLSKEFLTPEGQSLENIAIERRNQDREKFKDAMSLSSKAPSIADKIGSTTPTLTSSKPKLIAAKKRRTKIKLKKEIDNLLKKEYSKFDIDKNISKDIKDEEINKILKKEYSKFDLDKDISSDLTAASKARMKKLAKQVAVKISNKYDESLRTNLAIGSKKARTLEYNKKLQSELLHRTDLKQIQEKYKKVNQRKEEFFQRSQGPHTLTKKQAGRIQQGVMTNTKEMKLGKKITQMQKNQKTFDAILKKKVLPKQEDFASLPKKEQRVAIDTAVDAYAKKINIDTRLIQAIIQAESSYDFKAKSNKGAIGLMQLMPDTAKYLKVDPHNPQENIKGGMNYIKKLLKQFDGDLNKALAAYNWGPGNVTRNGIENMPKETRNYIKKVMAMYKKSGGK